MPEDVSHTEVVEASGKYAVPGNIGDHAHPYQLYQPLSLAKSAAERGTTTFIGDNRPRFHLPKEDALSLLEE